jgi:hypothetical protein
VKGSAIRAWSVLALERIVKTGPENNGLRFTFDSHFGASVKTLKDKLPGLHTISSPGVFIFVQKTLNAVENET